MNVRPHARARSDVIFTVSSRPPHGVITLIVAVLFFRFRNDYTEERGKGPARNRRAPRPVPYVLGCEIDVRFRRNFLFWLFEKFNSLDEWPTCVNRLSSDHTRSRGVLRIEFSRSALAAPWWALSTPDSRRRTPVAVPGRDNTIKVTIIIIIIIFFYSKHTCLTIITIVLVAARKSPAHRGQSLCSSGMGGGGRGTIEKAVSSTAKSIDSAAAAVRVSGRSMSTPEQQSPACDGGGGGGGSDGKRTSPRTTACASPPSSARVEVENDFRPRIATIVKFLIPISFYFVPTDRYVFNNS